MHMRRSLSRISEEENIKEAGGVEIVATFYETLSEEEKRALMCIRNNNKKKYKGYLGEVAKAFGMTMGDSGMTIAENAAARAWSNVRDPKDYLTMMDVVGERKDEKVNVNITFEDIVKGAKKTF